MDFESFFRTATKRSPYGYQVRLARDGLRAAVEAPTGTGKTGIVLAWLWRRLHGSDPDGTPRRLIYALPQRSLVEQVAGQVGTWLRNLGLTDEVALHVVMGGAGTSQKQWRLDMHKPAIVVGTVDSLVSKALNRGYGIGRAIYPIDFALVTNGAHWVIDEVQLCPESTTTLRQLAAFTRTLGTAEPFGLTCMSATVPKGLLDTVDNPAPEPRDVVRIEPHERIGELAVRLDASRKVLRLAADPGDYKAMAAAVLERHQPGTLTLVVVNTVAAARDVFRHLRGQAVPATLLHSRFRGRERQQLIENIMAEPDAAGRIVVATQVVEAGIDLNAALLVTEAAPWPSVVQRAGRCNRTGKVPGAQLCWIPPANARPYLEADVAAASAELVALEDTVVTGEGLLARQVPVTEQLVAVLRRPDLVSLFDTAPDLSGADLDISPYVRDADDLDAQVAWASWTPAAADGRPPAEAKAPGTEWRCRVPLGGVADLVKADIPVWRMDQAAGRWVRVTERDRARPGEVLLVAAESGGYDPVIGFDPAARKPLAEYPVLAPADPATGAEEPYRSDAASVYYGAWVSLDQHSEDARRHADALVCALRADLPDGVALSVVTAAHLHDVGKSHHIWQEALCRLAPAECQDGIQKGRPWAKSGVDGPLRYNGIPAFRHELASLLLVDGPLGGLLSAAPDADLARYLILAHHGKLRIQVRDAGEPVADALLGLRQGATSTIPELLGQAACELTEDIEQFGLGGDVSWSRTALALRDRYGPFVLAYLETLVRIADWRASAALEEAK